MRIYGTIPTWSGTRVHKGIGNAYNLGNFLRRLSLPRGVSWSLRTLREKLVKIGAKVVRSARYVTCQLAEVTVSRQLFAAILQRIGRLRSPRVVSI